MRVLGVGAKCCGEGCELCPPTKKEPKAPAKDTNPQEGDE